MIVSGYNRKFLSHWEAQKNLASFDDVKKTFCWLKNYKNLYFAWLWGQSVEQGQLIISKFGIVMLHIFVRLREEIKYFESLFIGNQDDKKSNTDQKCLVFVILEKNTKTDSEAEHYNFCINPIVKVCHDLYCSFLMD